MSNDKSPGSDVVALSTVRPAPPRRLSGAASIPGWQLQIAAAAKQHGMSEQQMHNALQLARARIESGAAPEAVVADVRRTFAAWGRINPSDDAFQRRRAVLVGAVHFWISRARRG